MRSGRTIFRWMAFGTAMLLAGCTHKPLKPLEHREGKIGPIDRVSHTEVKSDLPGSPVQHEGLAAAEDAYRREEFAKAGDMFAEIADDTKNRPEVAERARFYHAECLRRQAQYPKAVDAYHKLLQDFPAGL